MREICIIYLDSSLHGFTRAGSIVYLHVYIGLWHLLVVMAGKTKTIRLPDQKRYLDFHLPPNVIYNPSSAFPPSELERRNVFHVSHWVIPLLSLAVHYTKRSRGFIKPILLYFGTSRSVNQSSLKSVHNLNQRSYSDTPRYMACSSLMFTYPGKQYQCHSFPPHLEIIKTPCRHFWAY